MEGRPNPNGRLGHWNSCDAARGLGKHDDGGTRENRRVFSGHRGLVHLGTFHSSWQYGLSAPAAYPPRYRSPVLLYLNTSRSMGRAKSGICVCRFSALAWSVTNLVACAKLSAVSHKTTTSSRYGQLSCFRPSLSLATSSSLTTRLDPQTMTARARSSIRFTTRTVSPL